MIPSPPSSPHRATSSQDRRRVDTNKGFSMPQAGTRIDRSQLMRPTRATLSALLIITLLQTCRHAAWTVECGSADETGPLATQDDRSQGLSEEGAEIRAKALAHSDSLSSLFREPAECAVFAEYGPNYLTPIDVLVKATDSDTACIKARFSLSIRVEEAQFVNSRTGEVTDWKVNNQTNRPILGFVPLEHVRWVEESCPAPKAKPTDAASPEKKAANAQTKSESVDREKSAGDQKDDSEGENISGDDDKRAKVEDEDENELEMIVTFDCGKLSFTFRRDQEKIYVSAISGIVKLDHKIIRQFKASRPMFLTNDLDHHFKYDDTIEIVSEVQSGSHILTANFYQTEFEAFRSTTSRDFLKPPDEKSKPFSDECDLKSTPKEAR